MSIQICQLLSQPVLARVREAIDKGQWESVSTEQGVEFEMAFTRHCWRGPPILQRALNRLLLHGLKNNPKAASYSLGCRMSPFEWVVLSNGQGVMSHIQSPWGKGTKARADIGCILSLSNDREFQGGVLNIRYNGWQRCVKLAPGMAVLYPADAVIEIEAVKQGHLCLARNHIQSCVPEAEHRYVLQLLSSSRGDLMGDSNYQASLDRMSEVYARLLHQWSSD